MTKKKATKELLHQLKMNTPALELYRKAEDKAMEEVIKERLELINYLLKAVEAYKE